MSSPRGWYEGHGVERRGESVATIDPVGHAIELDSGDALTYSRLLIATGGRNRKLNVPGADLPGVHALRTLAECDAIRQEVGPGRHAVVVGMGSSGPRSPPRCGSAGWA